MVYQDLWFPSYCKILISSEKNLIDWYSRLGYLLLKTVESIIIPYLSLPFRMIRERLLVCSDANPIIIPKRYASGYVKTELWIYSKNIATFYELEAFRGNESRVSPIVLLFLHKCIKDVDSGEIKRYKCCWRALNSAGRPACHIVCWHTNHFRSCTILNLMLQKPSRLKNVSNIFRIQCMTIYKSISTNCNLFISIKLDECLAEHPHTTDAHFRRQAGIIKSLKIPNSTNSAYSK